eukprot:365542-Chlamydomonas_euryale.AAC.21
MSITHVHYKLHESKGVVLQRRPPGGVTLTQTDADWCHAGLTARSLGDASSVRSWLGDATAPLLVGSQALPPPAEPAGMW